MTLDEIKETEELLRRSYMSNALYAAAADALRDLRERIRQLEHADEIRRQAFLIQQERERDLREDHALLKANLDLRVVQKVLASLKVKG